MLASIWMSCAGNGRTVLEPLLLLTIQSSILRMQYI